jgi:hypothetical protein
VGELRDDPGAHPEDWTNPTLGDSLEALAGWVEDSERLLR